ncbi:MAG: ribonuclease HII [Rickettsiales bacterium]|nr:ribonuclease HII [Rickettsiales bacterium]
MNSPRQASHGLTSRARKPTLPDFAYEAAYNGLVAGVDEAGRAPLAGPVTAAAVILDPKNIPEGIDDSKKLSAKKRERLAQEIKQAAIAYSICECNLEEIEQLNILHASMLAMQRCVEQLSSQPTHALIDGNRLPKSLPCPATFIIKGDSKSLSIAAASILAKTSRDHLMQRLAQEYPGYGWERNAGYPTPQHIQALDDLGITPHHRRTFAPVRDRLLRSNLPLDAA